MVKFSLVRSSIYGFWFASKSYQIHQKIKIVLNGARKEWFIYERFRKLVKTFWISFLVLLAWSGNPIRILFHFNANENRNEYRTLRTRKINIHHWNCILLDENLHKQFTLCHVTHDWIIYSTTMSIYFYTLFLFVCLSFIPPVSSSIPHAISSLCRSLFRPLAPLLFFAHFLSVIHSLFWFYHRLMLQNWQKM